jgi:hypothetical protein
MISLYNFHSGSAKEKSSALKRAPAWLSMSIVPSNAHQLKLNADSVVVLSNYPLTSKRPSKLGNATRVSGTGLREILLASLIASPTPLTVDTARIPPATGTSEHRLPHLASKLSTEGHTAIRSLKITSSAKLRCAWAVDDRTRNPNPRRRRPVLPRPPSDSRKSYGPAPVAS